MLASPTSSPQSAAVGANQSSVDNLVATSSIVFSLGIPFNGKWQLHVKYYRTNRVKQVLIAAYI
jgi:hypothetical protein